MAILESLRHLDAPAEDESDELHREFSVKRLGMNETVAAQIERYRRLARRRSRVDHREVAALFRLVSRRSDAGLVFADAGRRMGQRAVPRGPSLLLRLLPRFARQAAGLVVARRAAARLDAVLGREQGRATAIMLDPPSAAATPSGAGCGFYGSALAEILRTVTDFDGALFHVRCRARGEDSCQWRAG